MYPITYKIPIINIILLWSAFSSLFHSSKCRIFLYHLYNRKLKLVTVNFPQAVEERDSYLEIPAEQPYNFNNQNYEACQHGHYTAELRFSGIVTRYYVFISSFILYGMLFKCSIRKSQSTSQYEYYAHPDFRRISFGSFHTAPCKHNKAQHQGKYILHAFAPFLQRGGLVYVDLNRDSQNYLASLSAITRSAPSI